MPSLWELLARVRRGPAPAATAPLGGPADSWGPWLESRNGFGERLAALKGSLRFRDPTLHWLPYSILGNFNEIEKTLKAPNRDLRALAGNLPVADIGAADGDLAFFLEAQGFPDIHIVDTASANCNRLEGARLLKDSLESTVQIHDRDLDALSDLPVPRYGLVFFLGTLYHLKNPYYALESLARRAAHCILSTRVFRKLPGGGRDLAAAPVAYLLEERELNNDVTNHWIFTPAGLRRILGKAGWDILDFATFGNNKDSAPDALEKGERAFCLLRSRRGAI